ncbi:MAG: CDP-glycerol:glycerophosphate glycerophosphotransferase [Actinomycetes bacterium]
MGAPRLGFLVAVHRGQAFVRECLTSILDQSPEDVEVVVVDDASPDHTPEILDEIEASDPRVRVRHLPERVGLPEARDLAAEMATAVHVWFVEPSDYLPAGSVAAVIERLGQARPDVLLVGHKRVDWAGQLRPSPYAPLLAGAKPKQALTLDKRPDLTDLVGSLWTAVPRRAHLQRLGLRFGGRAREPLGVTYPLALAAERVALLDRDCYHRRELRDARRDVGEDAAPEDVFAEADAVFAFLEQHGGAVAARRPVAVRGLVRRYVSVLEGLPEADRPAFFARMSESVRTHVPADEAPQGRLLKLQLEAIRRGSYRGFTSIGWAAERRRGLRKRQQQVAGWRARRSRQWQRSSLERYYRAQRREPLEEDLAVFAAYWYRGYACNPAAVYRKAKEMVPGLRSVWIVERQHASSMPDDVPYVVSGTREYYRVLARAKYLVNNVNFPNDFVKRDGQVHLQTHHGTPLKKMGLDLRDAPFSAARLNFRKMMVRCARWDLSVSANPFSTEIWERVYPVGFTSIETGYPRNDVLVTASADDVRRCREALGIEPGQRAVLYAPTHREYTQGYVPVLDLARVAHALGPDYVLMARTHYFYGADEHLAALHRAGRVLDVASHPSVEDLCLAADVLVTDYSSIMFDYAVLDRPIVVHAPDWEVYRAMRGTYFDLMTEPPGAVARTEEQLLEIFGSGEESGAEATRLRKAFRDRFCALEDGHAAERVVRHVWMPDETATGKGTQ